MHHRGHCKRQVFRRSQGATLSSRLIPITKPNRDIHPIAIFLKPSGPEVVRLQQASYSEEMARNVFALALRVHAEFRHQFTETVANEAFDRTYQRVVEIIRRESRDSYWAATGQRLP